MVLSISKNVISNFSRYPWFRINVKKLNTGCRSYSIASSFHGMLFKFRKMENSRTLCLSNQLMEKWVTITFLKYDGSRLKIRGKVGTRIKEMVQENNAHQFEGYGMCCGTSACSSCQVVFPPEQYAKLPEPTDSELDLLCFTDFSDTSRLGCSVNLTEDMDGIVLEVPSLKELKDKFMNNRN